MSSFDLSRVVDFLESSKTRDRNEALNTLENVSPSKLKLNPRQLNALISTLLRLIDTERNIYAHNRTNPVELRLSKASNFLSGLIKRSFAKDHSHRFNDLSPTRLKFKTCMSIIESVLSAFFVDSSVLQPCALDLIGILLVLLKENFVRDHFSYDHWCKVFNFLIRLGHFVCANGSGLGEKLLVECLTCILCLLDTDSSTSPLPLILNSNYFKLLSILKYVLKEYGKKESAPVSLTLKLSNKLLIVLSTQDVNFCHALVQMNLNIYILLINSQSDTIQQQLLIFLNLSSTAYYLSTHLLPKTVNLESEDGISFEDNIYNVGVLIKSLLPKLSSAGYTIDHDDIGLGSSEVTWFDLKTIFLKGHCEDPKPWLLHLGVTKLVMVYFTLKERQRDVGTVDTTNILGTIQESSSFRRKRQKLGGLSDTLGNSYTTIEFVKRLVTSSDEKSRLVGLKLLVFYVELLNETFDQKPQDDTFDFNESTIINTTFQFQSQSEIGLYDVSALLKAVFSCFDSPQLTFWSLLVCNCVASKHEALTSKQYFQMLKLALPLVKIKEFGHISCALVYTICFSQKEDQLTRVVDSSILNQVETISDLSEINGPHLIRDESFRLWYSLSLILKLTNSVKQTSFLENICSWLYAKWESQSDFYKCSQLPNFISWVSGAVSTYSPERKESYKGEALEWFRFNQRYSELQAFINLKSTTDPSKEPERISLPLFENEAMESVITKLLTRGVSLTHNNEEPLNLLLWHYMLLSIERTLPKDEKHLHLLHSIEYQCTSILQALNDYRLSPSEVLQLVDTFNTFDRLSGLSRLPFSKLEKKFFTLSVDVAVNSGVFEEEFGTGSPLPVHDDSIVYPTYISLVVGSSKPSRLIDFIIASHAVRETSENELMNSIYTYMSTLKDSDLLIAFHHLLVASDTNRISFSSVPESLLTNYIRLFGEGPMTLHVLERNEVTFIVLCKLIRTFLPRLRLCQDSNFKKDCYDLSEFILHCASKDLILTEESLGELCRLLVDLTNDESSSIIETSQVKKLLLSKFSACTNNVKVSLTATICDYMSKSPPSDQMSLYRELYDKFESPQQSIETSGTFAMFFCNISQVSSGLLTAAIYNLIELSSFEFFIPYSRLAFERTCQYLNLESSKALFSAFKFEIVKCWLGYGLDMLDFPFTLFDYSDITKFLNDNYRELVAILLSSKNIKSKTNLLDFLRRTKRIDAKSLVSDSLSLCIPLSFTAEGVRNDIFHRLAELLGTDFKLEIKNKLVVIVLDILRFTNIAGEAVDISPDTVSSQTETTTTSLISVSYLLSLALLDSLIGKHYSDVTSFWSSSTIYFLMRRLSLSVKDTVTGDQKITYLKLIKLVMKLGFENINCVPIFRLAVDIAVAHIQEKPAVQQHCVDMICAFDMSAMVEKQKAVPIVVRLACEILYSNKKKVYEPVSNSLRHCTIDVPVLQSILGYTVSVLKDEPVEFGTVELENIITNSEVTSAFKNLKDLEHLLKLVAHLFSDTTSVAFKGKVKEDVVKLLLSMEPEQNLTVSKEFSLWAVDYLAKFYVENDLSGSIDRIIDLKEYKRSIDSLFETSIGRMDHILAQIVQYIHDDNSSYSACAETILGVLMWKYNKNSADVTRYLDFSSYYDKLQFILPIDFHTCILLNSYDEEQFQLGESIDTFIGEMSSTILTVPLDIWTSRLVLSLIQELAKFSSIATLMSTFVTHATRFSESVLPDFVCFYLFCAGEEGAAKIKALLAGFPVKMKNIQYIKIFVNIVLLIRVAAKKRIVPFVALYDEIDVSTFHVLASRAKLFKTSLLFFEDCRSRKSDLSLESESLLRVYESIDDDDLIYGLPQLSSLEYTISMIDRSAKSSEELKYSSALFDAKLALNQHDDGNSITQTVLDNGLLGVSRLMGNNAHTYDWAWKLNRWDFAAPKTIDSPNEAVYSMLKQVHDRAEMDSLDSIQLEVLGRKNLFNLSTKEKRIRALDWFKSIACISGISEIVKSDLLRDSIVDMLTRSVQDTSWFASDLSVLEDVVLARKAAYQVLFDKFNTADLSLGLIFELSRYSRLTRVCHEQQKMVNAIVLLNEVVKGSSQVFPRQIHGGLSYLSTFHSASTLWSQGESSSPVAMLKQLYATSHYPLPITAMNIDQRLVGAILVEWMAVSRQEQPETIMEKYVEPINDMITDVCDIDQRIEIYHRLARFCEGQYKSHSKMETITKLEKRVREKKAEIDEIKSHYKRTAVPANEKISVQRYYNKLKSLFGADNVELTRLKDTQTNFRNKATQYYLKAIVFDSNGGEDLDKFFSLFLEHSHQDSLQRIIVSDIMLLPSYKSIGWCTQLVSRLADETSDFQDSLQNLILKVCYDHPYHSLYQLISLRKHESLATVNNAVLLSKVGVAKKIWNKLQLKSVEFTEKVLMPIERMCDESVKLAEHKGTKGKSIHIDKLEIGNFWIHELPSIPPPTMEVAVNSSGYDNVVRMVSMSPKIAIAFSGLSLPKIGDFTLSNGTHHKTLFKSGTDDLRQDSIMEQVFEKVNKMFMADRESHKRELRVRTYKAVPLGPQAGIIEFVANSAAFIDIIKPYHTTSDGMKADKARQSMKSCQDRDKSERIDVYRKITGRIKPVFRHFFFDNFVTPDTWFSSVSRYTRGTATNSIVGYALGLGDRHCNNILIDTNTGEPVHIDLGVAFDEGKRLPIPEMVPFRLTRDIVDGFGATGAQGAFSKSSEHTFRVLQQNREHIVAILDVLRWDPLYTWSISPIRKRKLQEDAEVKKLQPMEDGSEAGTAVLTVEEKLVGQGLSVEATIRELIQNATSEENLALIYCGWYPFF